MTKDKTFFLWRLNDSGRERGGFSLLTVLLSNILSDLIILLCSYGLSTHLFLFLLTLEGRAMLKKKYVKFAEYHVNSFHTVNEIEISFIEICGGPGGWGEAIS